MKMIWVIAIILVIVFLPLIPYEKEVQMGVVSIEYESIFSIAKERYEEIQAKEIMGVVPSGVSEVQGEDVAPKTQHVE